MSLVLQDKLEFDSLGGGGGSGAVNSVNGKTGNVVLDATDVGAMEATKIVNVSGSTATQELANNTIYNCGTMSNLSITLPANLTVDFISQVNFSSGSTATVFNAPNTMKWLGDDISSDTLVPVANKRYAIMIYYDGVNVRGISQSV